MEGERRSDPENLEASSSHWLGMEQACGSPGSQSREDFSFALSASPISSGQAWNQQLARGEDAQEHGRLG